MMNYRFQFYSAAAELPLNWDQIVATENILLSRAYFHVLDYSRPSNMQCFFGAFFLEDELIGGCLFQYLDFQSHQTFQSQEIACNIRNLVSKKLIRNLLILGNNMLTGQNAFYFNQDKISTERWFLLIDHALSEIQKKIKKSSLVILKDFQKPEIDDLKRNAFQSYFPFSVQPNMILILRGEWTNFEQYRNAFSKKYRTRITSAQKKLQRIEKKELSLSDLKLWSFAINSLYLNVAENSAINTFFLAENHFEELKRNLGENFRVFGYFSEDKLIGFYTLIINGNNLDTYFLGYQKELQKEKQLYLNMLLDMVDFGIKGKYEKIIFGRTALEIKSTIGAIPEEIFGLIRHNNSLVNTAVPRLFPYLEPKKEWVQRTPFKAI